MQRSAVWHATEVSAREGRGNGGKKGKQHNDSRTKASVCVFVRACVCVVEGRGS